MRPVFINGLGCLESGARLVLRELMRHYPAEGPRAILVLPSCNRADVAGIPPQVKVIALSHPLFGRWLRPLFELTVWLLAKAGRFSRIVNLSHYGLCPGGNYTLYFHNQLLIEEGGDVLVGHRGKPDRFKRWLLGGCLRRAERIIVQTEQAKKTMQRYAAARGITPAPIDVIAPLPVMPAIDADDGHRRLFAYQFFYPASDFSHKRAELAARGVIEANKRDARIGLVMTTGENTGPAAACVARIGRVSHAEACAQLAASDALLFTSSYETLGLPLLEAMTLGLPAVLPALEYARTIYGDSAACFEQATPESVADAIMRCVKHHDDWRQRVAGCRQDMERGRVPWAGHWQRFGVA